MSPHVAGLILARGGSQGIPLKNLAPLEGKPLIEWALGAMLSYGQFDSVWVSTDHSGIATCASGLGALVFPRSAAFAGPDSPSVEAVQEFLQSHPEVDIVALVQCTSPFLRPEFLSEAHRLMLEEDLDSVFSVTRQKKFRWSESDRRKGCYSRPLNVDPGKRPRRQDWDGDLVENGMFYFAKRDLIEARGLLQGGKKCTYVEVDAKLSIEIDSSLDLILAQQIALHEGLRPLSKSS